MSHEQSTTPATNVDTLPVSDAESGGVALESTLPDAVQSEVQLEDVLPESVDGTQSLDKVLPTVADSGFEQSAPSKPRVEMVVHEYETPQFGVTARIAPNRTIDFTLTFKPESVQGNAGDPVSEAEALVTGWLKQFYSEDETNKAAPTLQDPEFSVLAFLTRFPFTAAINIKPLLTAEKITENDKRLTSLVQIRLNSGAEHLPEGLAKFVRVQGEISVDFFKSVTDIILAAYKTQNPMADGVTIATIREVYLAEIPVPPGSLITDKAPQAVREPKVKQDKKPKQEPGVKKIEPPAEAPKKDKVTEVKPQERRRDETRFDGKGEISMAGLDAQLRRLARQQGEQHEEMVAVLRASQRQTADLLDANAALLEDNQTLFGVVNLLLAAIKAK